MSSHDATHEDLAILGMTCAACVRRIESGLLAVPGVTGPRSTW